MAQATKYRAKTVFWDSREQMVLNPYDVDVLYRCDGKLKSPQHVWRFDSQHEFRVFLVLVRMYGIERIERQVSIRIIPRCNCYPNGKKWKVDFVITKSIHNREIDCLVEAKGAFLPEFASVLVNLELEDKEKFRRTFIVFTNKVPNKNLVVRALQKSFFSKNLLTFKEFESRTQL